MAVNYKEYLAAQVLSDGRVVTYRSLSRALKIHVNVAKEMLYEFHHQQLSNKPGSVHATYLLSGTGLPTQPPLANGNHAKDGEDDQMQSSPFMSSSMPDQEVNFEQIPVQHVVLSREEDLESTRKLFEKISSIHLYSLEPKSLKDLQVLSDNTREIWRTTLKEDPLDKGRQYGSIHNPHIKRRSRRGPPPPQAPVAAMPVVTAKVEKTQDLQAPTTTDSTVPASASHAADKKTTKPSSLKRDHSDIFKSFAKSKPKLKKEGTGSSVGASVDTNEDERMKDASEEEQEEDLALPKSKGGEAGETKVQREERLRQMMDVDDEPAEESPAVEEEEDAGQEEPVQAIEEEQSVVPPDVVSGGRRRGKRRVTKKRTVKDEEGYLVTREEQVWESFSEDEAPKTSTPASSHSSAAGGKARKGPGKAGQGNLMFWFKK